MKDLAMMKRLTNLRDDFIEDAYLPDPVPVVPVKPRRTLPILGTPLALVGRIAAASVAGIAVLSVVFGIALPALTDGDETVGESYETASGLSSEALTDTEETDLTETNILIDIQPQTVHPGDTVQITILDPDDRKVSVGFDLCFTYATVPVGRDLLAYVPESESDPYVYTVTIPENAPVGQYDLIVEWEDKEKILEKVLTILIPLPEQSEENGTVTVNWSAGTLYPYKWSYGSRQVIPGEDAYDDSWGYMFADGTTFFPCYWIDPETLPTLVWDGTMTVEYAEQVYNKNGDISIYDRDQMYVNKRKEGKLDEYVRSLDRGIYYLIIPGSYYGTDHTEEVMAAAIMLDETWGSVDQFYQKEVQTELEKDPYVFTDRHYAEYILRVIVP